MMSSNPHPDPQLDPHPDLQTPKKVLVVDCDSSIVERVSAVLPAWEMVCAPNNKTAFSLVEKSPFDLVITAEKSKGKDDVELLRAVRQVRPCTRLIILADQSTPADVIDAIRDHAFSYFTAPFSKLSFEEMLRLAMETPAWDEGIELLSATPEWIRLKARCDMGTANRLLQFLHEAADLPKPEAERIGVAFREILLNAMEHGGKFDPGQYVEISYVHAHHMVMCRIKDPGAGFSLDNDLNSAISNPADDPVRHLLHRQDVGMRPGGYGVLLAKKLVDELIYGEKGNDVLLIKYLDAPNSGVAAAGK